MLCSNCQTVFETVCLNFIGTFVVRMSYYIHIKLRSFIVYLFAAELTEGFFWWYIWKKKTISWSFDKYDV